MHIGLAAPLLLGLLQAVLLPAGTEEMRIERAVARFVRTIYPTQTLGYEEISQEFATPHAPTGPVRAGYRTPQHTAALVRDLRAVVRLRTSKLCEERGQTGCISTVIRIGTPVITADSATVWLYAYDPVVPEEYDQKLLVKRGPDGWFVAGTIENRVGLLIRRPP